MSKSVLHDETGALSSKRVMGLCAGATLCAMGLAQAFSPLQVQVDGDLVDALQNICIGCLLWATVDKFSPRAKAFGDVDAEVKRRESQQMRAMPDA